MKILSKIKSFFVMAFIFGALSFSDTMWSGYDFSDFGKFWWQVHQAWIGVSWDVAARPSSYQTFFLSENLFNVLIWIEIALVLIIILVWIIGYFKIRKIEDKNVKSKKIKNVVSLLIGIFGFGVLLLCYYYFFVWLFSVDCWCEVPDSLG